MVREIKDRVILLNDGVIRDLIAAHLYAVTELSDDDEVLELHLGEMHDGMRRVHYKAIKNKEVELIVHS